MRVPHAVVTGHPMALTNINGVSNIWTMYSEWTQLASADYEYDLKDKKQKSRSPNALIILLILIRFSLFKEPA